MTVGLMLPSLSALRAAQQVLLKPEAFGKLKAIFDDPEKLRPSLTSARTLFMIGFCSHWYYNLPHTKEHRALLNEQLGTLYSQQ